MQTLTPTHNHTYTCIYTTHSDTNKQMSSGLLRSVYVSGSHMHHWLVLTKPISKWLTWHFLLLQRVTKKTVKNKENDERCTREWGRHQTTYYSDVDFLIVRQPEELCHAERTNRRHRNGAIYGINAGMRWELPAWGSFPLSRQTEGAYSNSPVTVNTKTQPTCTTPFHLQQVDVLAVDQLEINPHSSILAE